VNESSLFFVDEQITESPMDKICGKEELYVVKKRSL